MDNGNFHGTWSTNTFGEMKLKQDGLYVTGTYTRNHGGVIQGTVREQRLEFRWQDQDGSNGRGFLRIVPSTGTIVGLWGDADDETQSRDIFAELVEKSSVDFQPQLPSDNMIEIKHLGYDLMGQSKYAEAIAAFEKALELYRDDRERHSWLVMKESHLISEAQILFCLCTCYYCLADYGILQETQPLLNRREDFYDKLLFHLEDAVKTYRQYMKNSIRKYSAEPFELALKNDLVIRVSESIDQNVGGTQEAIAQLASVLEQWRQRLASDHSKIMALDKGKAFFQKLIQLLIDLGSEQQALLFSEEARTRAFADLLASKETIRQTIQTTDDHQPSPLSAPSITLAALIETVAQRKSTTIEYFIGEHNLIIWVIAPDGKIRMCQYAITEQRLDWTVQRLLELLKRAQVQRASIMEGSASEHELTELSQVLEQLYTYLIAPIPVEWLPALPEEVITIVPHGSLFQVPFAALRHRDVRFIAPHAHVLAPSINLLHYTAEHARHILHAGQSNLLAFVNPAPMPEEHLQPLAVAEEQAADLLKFYAHAQDNLLLVGRAAEKQRLLRDAAHYTTLLFATHGEA